jgi:hypothetical protein
LQKYGKPLDRDTMSSLCFEELDAIGVWDGPSWLPTVFRNAAPMYAMHVFAFSYWLGDDRKWRKWADRELLQSALSWKCVGDGLLVRTSARLMALAMYAWVRAFGDKHWNGGRRMDWIDVYAAMVKYQRKAVRL